MPELPEVETVRAGLARWVTGRTIASASFTHPRTVRRHPGGSLDLATRLAGRQVESVQRRGKYLWLVLDAPSCLVAHLGMSGQLLLVPADAPVAKHTHARLTFHDHENLEVRFVDQRTFGELLLDELVPTTDAPDAVPSQLAHIARDPLDPHFDDARFRARLRTRRSEVKRALLDQSLISGVGNIYADESLWRARTHPSVPCAALSTRRVNNLLAAIRAVFSDALAAGGTSFDSLYVNVNGQSGYFDRSLAVYGREGQACPRCGSAIRRTVFMNRSSHFCPRCQRVPAAP